MTTKSLAIAAAALLIASAIPAQAENNTTTPGHKMQTKGSVKGQPGASGYVTGGLNARIDGEACAGEDKGAVEAPGLINGMAIQSDGLSVASSV